MIIKESIIKRFHKEKLPFCIIKKEQHNLFFDDAEWEFLKKYYFPMAEIHRKALKAIIRAYLSEHKATIKRGTGRPPV